MPQLQHGKSLTNHVTLSINPYIFAALPRKSSRQKAFWTGIDRGRNRCLSGRVVDLEVFNKTIILLGLDIK